MLRRRAPQHLRGGRQRPVDLRVARGGHPQHLRIRRGLPRRRGHPPGAELPVDEDDPRRRQRRHRQQRHPGAQGAVDRRRRGRPHRALPGRGRVRRGGLGRHRDRPAARVRRHRLRRRRRLLPHQRPEPGLGGGARARRHPLQGGGGHPLLRPARGEGPPRLRAPARQPLRRGLGPAHRERAPPGRGRRLGGPPGPVGTRPPTLVRRRPRPRRRGRGDGQGRQGVGRAARPARRAAHHGRARGGPRGHRRGRGRAHRVPRRPRGRGHRRGPRPHGEHRRAGRGGRGVRLPRRVPRVGGPRVRQRRDRRLGTSGCRS